MVVPRRTSTARQGLDLAGATAITAASALVVLGITLAGTPAASLLTVGAPVAVAALLDVADLVTGSLGGGTIGEAGVDAASGRRTSA